MVATFSSLTCGAYHKVIDTDIASNIKYLSLIVSFHPSQSPWNPRYATSTRVIVSVRFRYLAVSTCKYARTLYFAPLPLFRGSMLYLTSFEKISIVYSADQSCFKVFGLILMSDKPNTQTLFYRLSFLGTRFEQGSMNVILRIRRII